MDIKTRAELVRFSRLQIKATGGERNNDPYMSAGPGQAGFDPNYLNGMSIRPARAVGRALGKRPSFRRAHLTRQSRAKWAMRARLTGLG